MSEEQQQPQEQTVEQPQIEADQQQQQPQQTEQTEQTQADTEPQEQKETYTYSIYNRFFDSKDEDDDGKPRLSRRFIDKLLCSDISQYYRTHEFNEILYLHFKGFEKIENLDTFKNLKVLYLEGNAIKKIEGLSKLTNLTSLYLHQNVIETIEGLDTLIHLYNLNLSDNLISKVENLSNCKELSNLLLKRNRIGFNGLSDLDGLLELNPKFSVLDISDNHIHEAGIVDEYLTKIKGLRVLYLSGNECTRKISNYRKTLIAKISDIRYIDDRPVFDDERRFALAFARGGIEEERKERALYRQEQKEKEEKRIKDFIDMMNKYKGEKGDESGEQDVKKETEEERERKKMELLKKLKEKRKNDIFNEDDIGNMPHIKKEEIMNKDNKADESVKEGSERKEEECKAKDNEEDMPPELEQVKEMKLKKDVYEDEKEEEIDTSSKKHKDNKKDNDDDDVGVSIQIKELDELD